MKIIIPRFGYLIIMEKLQKEGHLHIVPFMLRYTKRKGWGLGVEYIIEVSK